MYVTCGDQGMRTTIRLHAVFKRQASRYAQRTGRTFTQLVEVGLRRLMREEGAAPRPAPGKTVELPSADLGRPAPGVDLRRTSELLMGLDLVEQAEALGLPQRHSSATQPAKGSR